MKEQSEEQWISLRILRMQKELVDGIEEEINQKEREIETLCRNFSFNSSPATFGDLRQISSALKMISDMERGGDGRRILRICHFVQVKELAHKIHIGEMAEAAIKMVTESIDSFVKKDLEAAAKVVEYDDVVDNLFLKVKQELPNMMEKGCSAGRILH